jgi:hypothetical protein
MLRPGVELLDLRCCIGKSGRRKYKTATFRRKSAIPTIARSARNMVTLDIVILELPWLSIVVDAWFVSVSFVAITQSPSLAE